ncbi:MAG: PEP-CTERM sorting domain-containing protein [Akkermansiaceae bacterium]|nr:PEP-CTERM sorting domain-containing protein [Akkermansiaceae bacterium]
MEPVDSSTTPEIPNVPEPSASLLIVISTAVFALRRSRGEAAESKIS